MKKVFRHLRDSGAWSFACPRPGDSRPTGVACPPNSSTGVSLTRVPPYRCYDLRCGSEHPGAISLPSWPPGRPLRPSGTVAATLLALSHYWREDGRHKDGNREISDCSQHWQLFLISEAK
jgi:hypothetical protein